jgi:hypothetical protein
MFSKTAELILALLQHMKYLDLLWALDVLYRFYPRYHTHDLILLAEDIWKWVNHELPDDSAALVYLKTCFDSPAEALQWVWDELELLAGPYLRLN